jgi:hypothetical protein
MDLGGSIVEILIEDLKCLRCTELKDLISRYISILLLVEKIEERCFLGFLACDIY